LQNAGRSAAGGTLRCNVEFDGSLNRALMKLRAASHKGVASPSRYRVRATGLGEIMAEAAWSPTGNDIAYIDGRHIRVTTAEGDAFSSGVAFAGAGAGWEQVAVHADGGFARDRFDVGDFGEWRLAAACASRRRTRPTRCERNVAGRWKYFVFWSGVDLRSCLAVDT
jgi:hypothetical protein